MKRIILLFCLLASLQINAQQIQIPANLEQEHPRVLTNAKGKEETKQLIANEPWAKDVFARIKQRIDKYVDRHVTDPEWIVSRLQMYWKSHSTDVFINGEVYSHAEGNAPVPTVRYTGTRATNTIYGRPKLEDILPYMDDPRGLYFHNNSKEGHPLEWAEQSKTGRNIESINQEIMNMARDAAFIYWVTDEEKYAKFAQDLFDMYMNSFYNTVSGATSNMHRDWLDAWTTSNINASMPRLIAGSINVNNCTSLAVQNGDYLKLRNIELGYTLPQTLVKKINISKMRIFVDGTNLLYLTNYKGFSPEVGGAMGVDYNCFPIAGSFNFGVNLTF